MTDIYAESDSPSGSHRKAHAARNRRRRLAIIAVVIGSLVAVGTVVALNYPSPRPSGHVTGTVSYLGAYEPDAPSSYAGLDNLARAIGRQPNLVAYYSHWLEPFQNNFATAAQDHGATTLVQIAPGKFSLTSIADGRYDTYLRSYANAVKAFHSHIVLSFGHEMNGGWYSWGYKHASPAAFVAAWRHIVSLFRKAGANNVTWMWTVNIIGKPNIIPAPRPWWPGSSYVNWVGIDGYFWYKAAAFNSVFASTIVYVRELTHDPILIAETGAEPAVGQPAKIAQLFAGIRAYGLLGFVWFNDDDTSAAIPNEVLYWRLSPPALMALRNDAKEFMKPHQR